jgi:molecular chaperone GrpE
MTHHKHHAAHHPADTGQIDPLAPSPSSEELEAAQTASAPVQSGNAQIDLNDLKTLQTKLAELADHTLRAQAEAQNARRRADEEVAKIRKFAIESFAESLLPVIDSLEAGLKVDHASAEQLREGTEATLRQLLAVLERNKVIEVNPAPGAKFDPANQQAISVVPSEQETGTVVSVLQKGYTIAERVLRPALVIVAASK